MSVVMRVLFHANVNAISEGNAMSQNFEREDKINVQNELRGKSSLAVSKLLLLNLSQCSMSHQLPTEELPSNASILSKLPFAFCSADEQFQGSSVLIYSSKKSLAFYMQKGYSKDNPSIASCSPGGIYLNIISENYI